MIFSPELRFHVISRDKIRQARGLHGEVLPASQKDPEGGDASDQFTDVLETAELTST